MLLLCDLSTVHSSGTYQKDFKREEKTGKGNGQLLILLSMDTALIITIIINNTLL